MPIVPAAPPAKRPRLNKPQTASQPEALATAVPAISEDSPLTVLRDALTKRGKLTYGGKPELWKRYLQALDEEARVKTKKHQHSSVLTRSGAAASPTLDPSAPPGVAASAVVAGTNASTASSGIRLASPLARGQTTPPQASTPPVNGTSSTISVSPIATPQASSSTPLQNNSLKKSKRAAANGEESSRKPAEAAASTTEYDAGHSELSEIHPDNRPVGDDTGSKLDTARQEMKLSKEDVPDSTEITLEEADARVVEAAQTPDMEKKVLDLYQKHFNLTPALNSYVRGEHRCRTWVLVSDKSPIILAACTVRINAYVWKNGCAWAQIMYAASSRRLCGFGKTLMAGVEELMWEERVDLYGLHSLRKSVDFWAALGMRSEKTLLPHNEHSSVAGGYQRWVMQTDKQGRLPLFAKWLIRPYIHPPLMPETEGVAVPDARGRKGETRIVLVGKEEKIWKKFTFASWPAWRLTPKESSRIKGEDLTTRTKLIRSSAKNGSGSEVMSLARPTATGLTEKDKAPSLLIRLNHAAAQELCDLGQEAGWKGKARGRGEDPATVLTRSQYKFKVFLPAKLAKETVVLGPIVLNVMHGIFCEFSGLWRPDPGGKGTKFLVWSHCDLAVTGQVVLTVNNESHMLEPNSACTWAEQDAVGFNFASVKGDAMVTIEVVQTARGLLPVSAGQKKVEPPSIASLQGEWHNDRNMTFKVEDHDVILMNPIAKIDKTSQPMSFGTLEFGIERNGWLKLGDYQMISEGTSVQKTNQDRLAFKNFENRSTIIWTRLKPTSSSR